MVHGEARVFIEPPVTDITDFIMDLHEYQKVHAKPGRIYELNRTGDTVAVFPSKTPVRVRSIHSQNRPADVGRSGERCALNISGVEKSALKRGDWLADARALAPTTRIDVRFELVADTHKAFKAWAPVHFHHGAAHLTAHVVPLEGSTITPGSPCLAQIVLETPICAIPGDRFIVRDAQATHTLGGGVVLDPFAPSRKRRSPERMRYLHALERMIEGEGLAPLLAEASYGVKQSDLIRLIAQSPERMALPDGVTTVDGTRERYILLSSAWRALREQAVHALRKFHVESPDEPGPDVGRLRRMALPQLADDLWRALLAELAAERLLDGGQVWLDELVIVAKPAVSVVREIDDRLVWGADLRCVGVDERAVG